MCLSPPASSIYAVFVPPKLNIKRALKQRKITAYRFAQMLGVDYRNVWRVLRPDYDPKWSTLVKLAKLLKCRIRDIYRE